MSSKHWQIRKVDLVPGNMIDNEELLDHIHHVGMTLYDIVPVRYHGCSLLINTPERYEL